MLVSMDDLGDARAKAARVRVTYTCSRPACLLANPNPCRGERPGREGGGHPLVGRSALIAAIRHSTPGGVEGVGVPGVAA